MKYFIDTEFIEGFNKPLFEKERHFIDLISIGIVCEDGREYYAISNEYNYKDADTWVIKNVILPMYRELTPIHKENCSPFNFHKSHGKSNKDIAKEVARFVYNIEFIDPLEYMKYNYGQAKDVIDNDIQFYGYYADYDWVLLCSLFGRMIDLPKGFPMYCKDLKQMMDDNKLTKDWKRKNCPDPEGAHNALTDARWNYKLFKEIRAEE